jgi:hypothetical protein
MTLDPAAHFPRPGRTVEDEMENTEQGRPSIPEIQREYAGSWVALKDGVVVDARPTPYELVSALHERGITDTTIIRAPDHDEPELVGLG